MVLLEILASATSDATEATVTPSLSIIILAGLTLLTCLVIVLGLFMWARRLRVEGALKNTLLEGVSRMELQHLINDLDDEAWNAPLNSKENPFPEAARKIGLDHRLYLRSEAVRDNRLYFPEDEFVPPPLPPGIEKDAKLRSQFENRIKNEKKAWEAEKKGSEEYLEWEKKNWKITTNAKRD